MPSRLFVAAESLCDGIFINIEKKIKEGEETYIEEKKVKIKDITETDFLRTFYFDKTLISLQKVSYKQLTCR